VWSSCWSVSWSVCWGHHEPYKNGWTGGDVVWGQDSCGISSGCTLVPPCKYDSTFWSSTKYRATARTDATVPIGLSAADAVESHTEFPPWKMCRPLPWCGQYITMVTYCNAAWRGSSHDYRRCIDNLIKFAHLVFEICSQTYRHADGNISNTFLGSM